MDAKPLLEYFGITMPQLTGTLRVHRMERTADEILESAEENRRVDSIVDAIYRNGEKKRFERNQSRGARHERIVSFISKLSCHNAIETHDLAHELGLNYPTTVNDLIEIRKAKLVSYSNPAHSGIGRKYWGLSK